MKEATVELQDVLRLTFILVLVIPVDEYVR